MVNESFGTSSQTPPGIYIKITSDFKLSIFLAPEKGEDTRHKIAEILRKKGIKLNRNEMENLVDEIAAEIKGEVID